MIIYTRTNFYYCILELIYISFIWNHKNFDNKYFPKKNINLYQVWFYYSHHKYTTFSLFPNINRSWNFLNHNPLQNCRQTDSKRSKPSRTIRCNWKRELKHYKKYCKSSYIIQIIIIPTRIYLRHCNQEIGSNERFMQEHSQFRWITVPYNDGQHKEVRNAAQCDYVENMIGRHQTTGAFVLQRSMAERH